MSKFSYTTGGIAVDKIKVNKKVPMEYNIPYMVGVSTTYLVNGWDIHTSTAAYAPKHLALQPPYPVRLTVVPLVAGSAGHTDRISVAGYDAKGNYVVESVAVQATVGAAAMERTVNAFSKVVSLTPSNTAGIKPKTTDVNVGISSTIGLPWPIASSADILTLKNGMTYATAFYNKAKISAQYDTLTLTKMTAGSTLSVVYLTKLQE